MSDAPTTVQRIPRTARSPTKAQRRVSRIAAGLTRALKGPDTRGIPLPLDEPHRIVILSDQHKGAGDGADEFRLCKPAYMAALEHYLMEGYTLVLLGDVEELWEQSFEEVVRAHEDVLLLEGRFPAQRYLRVWGNHDDRWMRKSQVGDELGRYLPHSDVVEGLRYSVTLQGRELGTLLLVHGHQGQLFSDRGSWWARHLLPGYRLVQRLTGIGRTTPARDACLRGAHDREMYTWAAGQDRLILIAGHTHRPVWMSCTHAQKLARELAELEAAAPGTEPSSAIVAKRIELEERLEKVPPCEDIEGTRPCYFNSGCCKFDDGDITGLEMEDGELRLVKWWSAPSPPGRTVLERAPLQPLFAELANELH